MSSTSTRIVLLQNLNPRAPVIVEHVELRTQPAVDGAPVASSIWFCTSILCMELETAPPEFGLPRRLLLLKQSAFMKCGALLCLVYF